MKTTEHKKLFQALRRLLQKNARGLRAYRTIPGSRAKDAKPAYHLYGKRIVSIAGRKPQQTYVVGIIQQKHFVGLYFMPIYSHPGRVRIENAQLRKCKKGKSCLNITRLDGTMEKEITRLVRVGRALYHLEGWI